MASHTLDISYEGFPEPIDKYPSIPIGHVLSVKGQFKVDGTLTNPTANTITIEEPDGTNNTPTASSSATGVYTASFTPDQSGWHRVKWTGTTAVAVTRESAFYVFSSGIV